MSVAQSTAQRLYGLIGFPVKHSLSGFMHNAAFAALGMNARYELFEISPDKLDVFFKKTIQEKNLCGFNVTIPHKEKVLAYMAAPIPSDVESIGAANTVRVDKGKLLCANTDATGFMRHLQALQFRPENKTIAIIGAGGAAKAVSVALALCKPRHILLFDTDQQKARDLAERLKSRCSFESTIVDSVKGLDIRRADLLVNATPVGMKQSDPCLVDAADLHSRLVVYDLIYNPAQTLLLKQAKQAGAVGANGLRMLLYQGVLAFELWTGIHPPEDVMWQALVEHLPQ